MDTLVKPPFRKLAYLSRDIETDRRADGSIVLRSRHKLNPYERHIPAYLAKWAREKPDHVWLAQRRGPERAWFKLSYGEAKRQVDRLTQALLDRKLSVERPVMILSGNSIEHALLTQAAMQAGVPAAPVSQAYSLMSQDHAKLKHVFELLTPGLILVQYGPPFERALRSLDLKGVEIVHVDMPPEGIESTPWSALLATEATEDVERSIAALGPKTIGKFLFTSGSTGLPKAVINTQEMMCANVAMGRQARPRQPGDPSPVVLDWLPWNHTMGGNAAFHALLAEGGTHYIDDGKPIPGMFDETLRNLREVSPTTYSNVPAGYAALAAALEKDDALAQSFFKQLTALSYGGATLPDDLYERMQALAIRHTGQRLVFFTGWGSTETAPTATATYWETERVGLIGLPYPGVELKLVPAGGKYELRLRGITVMPGYYKRPDLTAEMFDEEGFYKIGDAGDFVDPADPSQGLVFKGRVVEDFKLMSGTFVHVGSLRVAAIAAASPAIQDAVVTGQDKQFIGLLAWPNVMACRQIAGDANATPEALIKHPKVIETVRAGIARHNKDNPGSSARIRRVVLMAEPPSIDGNELTDKGYINQRATLERRAALVDRLYAEPPGPDVIVV
jgi:feruloyl-CoA synthase